MNQLAPWQRTLYFLGEAVMVGGLLWGLYRVFIIRGCPVSTFNDITLIVLGLALSTLPLHPFGTRAYFTPVLRRNPAAAMLWWLLALTGLGYSLYVRFTTAVPMDLYWAYALVPAVLFFWFAIPSKLTDRPIPPAKAPSPPPRDVGDNESITHNGEDDA
jgi:hypothetical protein